MMEGHHTCSWRDAKLLEDRDNATRIPAYEPVILFVSSRYPFLIVCKDTAEQDIKLTKN
jgi:hypothetical protein